MSFTSKDEPGVLTIKSGHLVNILTTFAEVAFALPQKEIDHAINTPIITSVATKATVIAQTLHTPQTSTVLTTGPTVLNPHHSELRQHSQQLHLHPQHFYQQILQHQSQEQSQEPWLLAGNLEQARKSPHNAQYQFQPLQNLLFNQTESAWTGDINILLKLTSPNVHDKSAPYPHASVLPT